MQTELATLTAVQSNVLNHLAAGRSIAEAAGLCGVHRNTVANWRRTIPAFTTLLNEAVRERTAAWQEEALVLAPQALHVLRTILHNEDASPSVLLRAALATLKIARVGEKVDPSATHLAALPELEPEPTPESARPLSEALTAQIDEMQQRQKEFHENLHNYAQAAAPLPIRRPAEPGRNSQCPCGSGLKYKRCCANASSRPPASAA
jgi:hypothetical protein